MSLQRLQFTDMWQLVVSNNRYSLYRKEFSDELLIGIFWEESFFTNHKQLNRKGEEVGPAVGFGQVQPGAIHDVNDRFGRIFNQDEILGNNDRSVEITILLLKLLRYSYPKMRALEKYAGPKNIYVVRRWLKCEAMLKSGGTNNPDNVRIALTAARPDSPRIVPSVLKTLVDLQRKSGP